MNDVGWIMTTGQKLGEKLLGVLLSGNRLLWQSGSNFMIYEKVWVTMAEIYSDRIMTEKKRF